MPSHHVRTIVAVVWISAVCGAGLAGGVTSVAAWAGLAAFAVVPVLIMRHYWQAPAQSMSESIQEALR